MKKSIALVALAFGVTNAFAQDLTSKKGEPILPEAGDWGIGIDATSFLEYAGSFFGKSESNTAPSFNFLNTTQVITGRYFKDAQTVYRGSLRIGLGSTTERMNVANRSLIPVASNFPNADPTVQNTYKQSSTNIGLSFGIEKRKGKTRLQGYYGAEAGIYISSTKDKFTYGNNLTPSSGANTNAVTVSGADNFPDGSNVITTGLPITGGNIDNAGYRVIQRKSGATLSVGVRAFVGVEYFILPKMSLGGEFGWGLGVSVTGKGSTSYESTGNIGGNAIDQAGITTLNTAKSGSVKVDTDNKNTVWGPSGNIRLNFYF